MLIEQGRNCIWFQTLLVMEFLRQGCIGARQLLQEPGLRRASQRPEDGVGGFSGEGEEDGAEHGCYSISSTLIALGPLSPGILT